MVDDLINPIIGMIIGGIDFSDFVLRFGEGDYAATIRYGAFLTSVINFLIIAWVVFLLVKGVNKLKDSVARKEEAAAAAAGPTELDVLLEIRDALKK